MEKLKTQKGITLIALIITIIVMLILVGVSVTVALDGGLFSTAKEAADKTNMAQVREIAELAWLEAYLSTPGDVDSLKQAVNSALVSNGLNPNDYGILVTTEGVTIVNGWVQDKDKIIRGDKTIQVGDTVNYDDGVTTYTGDWKVLGADENGQILLVSDSIGTLELKGIEDYYEGISKLDNMCKPYGNGEGAVNARSIKAEDIARIVNYNPSKTFTGEKCRQGTEYEYGNIVTYKNTAGVISTTATNNIQIDDITKTAELSTPVSFKYLDNRNIPNLIELKSGEEYTVENDYFDLTLFYDMTGKGNYIDYKRTTTL